MIVIVCGPPGAGKTTVASLAVERLAAAGHGFRVLRSDDFRSPVYERMAERVAAAPDETWLLDGTFYRTEWRERFRRFGTVREVYVRADPETCLRRNRERADPIDERGVRAIHAKFERPREDLLLDTDELSTDEAGERLFRAVVGWMDAKEYG